jgi:hypothetical protein
MVTETPLAAWRKTQRRLNHRTKEPETLTQARACREFGVAQPVWRAWEMQPGSQEFKMPDPRNMVKIFVFTRGQVRPDHFYKLPRLRDREGKFFKALDAVAAE